VAGDDDMIFGNLPPRRKPLTAADIVAGNSPFGRQEMRQYDDPTFSGQVGTALEHGAERLGAPMSVQRTAGDIGRTAAGFSGLDMPQSVSDAVNYARQGYYGQSALAALGAIPVVPDAAGAAAAGGRRALTDIAPDIRGLPVAEGVAQARTEAHLVPSLASERGKPLDQITGGFVGAPPDIKTYADLQARRAQVDDYIGQHLGGADWYDRARTGINAAVGGDPQAYDMLAGLHGMTSAGVSPEAETAFTLKEAVSRAAGDPQVGHYGAQSRKLDAAIEANDPTPMTSGNKVEEYAAKIAEARPFQNATGVNDFRQRKLWGYPGRDEGVDPATGGDTFHRWLDYENALAVGRANDIGLGGRTNWTGEQIQAVPWVTQKAEDRGIPFEEAAKSGPDYYAKHAAAATYEQWPGGKLVEQGHLPGATGATADQRTAFSADDPWTDATGRDVIYGGGRVYNMSGERTGLGVPTLPTLSATGVWKDETNPARIAQPVVPFDVSSKDKPAIGGAPVGTKDVSPFAQTFMNAAEHVRSVFGAQEGGGWNKLWAKQAPGAQNAVFVPLDRDATRPEIDALSKAGEPFGYKDVTSTNGGLAVLNYDGAPKLKSKDRDALLTAIGNAKPDDAGDHIMTRANTGYAGPNYTTPGAGTATQGMLDAIGGNPFFTENAGIGQAAGALSSRDQAFADQFGPERQDFFNLRQLAAANGGAGWSGRLQDALKTGVPVSIGGVALYPTAGLPSTQPAPRQPPQGTTLNSGPNWMDQYWQGGGL
jgi:hypothetical protein